jgi:hypothetical protein
VTFTGPFVCCNVCQQQFVFSTACFNRMLLHALRRCTLPGAATARLWSLCTRSWPSASPRCAATATAGHVAVVVGYPA